MTWSGPCTYHCGSRVSVGVKVAVGEGVSEDRRVGVFVGKNIGVIVAGGVGEGNGSAVQVGSMIGVGGTAKLNPPQLMSRSVNPDIQTKNFRKSYSG
jgi:hypothetical protein